MVAHSLYVKVVAQGITIRIRGFSAQTPLGSWLELGNQPRFEAVGDLYVENEKRKLK